VHAGRVTCADGGDRILSDLHREPTPQRQQAVLDREELADRPVDIDEHSGDRAQRAHPLLAHLDQNVHTLIMLGATDIPAQISGQNAPEDHGITTNFEPSVSSRCARSTTRGRRPALREQQADASLNDLAGATRFVSLRSLNDRRWSHRVSSRFARSTTEGGATPFRLAALAQRPTRMRRVSSRSARK